MTKREKIESLCLIIMFALSILSLSASFNLSPILGDEGVLAMDGYRVYKGEIPNRDFFQFIPPLAAYIQAASFKIFGLSVFSIRIVGFFYAFVLLGLGYWLYKRFLNFDLSIAASLFLVVPGGFCGWMFGSHHWLVDILLIASALFLLFSVEKKRILFSMLAGIFAGLAILTMQDQGFYYTILLLICALFSKKGRKYFYYSFFASALTFLLLGYFFALIAGFYQVCHDWFYFPLFFYTKTHKSGIRSILALLVEEWNISLIKIAPCYFITYALRNNFLLLSPIFSLFSFMIILKKKIIPPQKIGVLAAITFSFMLAGFHRIAPSNMTWAFASTLPVFVLMEHFMKKERAKRIIPNAILISMYVTFLLLSLSELHLILGNKINKAEIFSPAGNYYSFNGEEADALNRFISVIENNVPKNDPMFCVGYIPLINFLTLRNNPTRFNFMDFNGYFSESQKASFLDSIKKNKICWGISTGVALDEKKGKKLLPGFRIYYANEKFVLWKIIEDTEGCFKQ